MLDLHHSQYEFVRYKKPGLACDRSARLFGRFAPRILSGSKDLTDEFAISITHLGITLARDLY